MRLLAGVWRRLLLLLLLALLLLAVLLLPHRLPCRLLRRRSGSRWRQRRQAKLF